MSLLEALIDLAQRQLAVILERGTNLDAQALGLIGFDAVFAAACLAAQQSLGAWWIPAPGLSVSSAFAARALAVSRFDFGPSPTDFYARNRKMPTDGGLLRLLDELLDSQRRNAEPLRLKTGWLNAGLLALAVTVVYSVAILAIA